MLVSLLALLVLSVSTACDSSAPPPTPPARPSSEARAASMDDPRPLVALMTRSPDAWQAMRYGRSLVALRAFEDALHGSPTPALQAELQVGRARAALASAAVFGLLARAQARVVEHLARHPGGRLAAARFGGAEVEGITPPRPSPSSPFIGLESATEWSDDVRLTAAVADLLARRAVDTACVDSADRALTLLCAVARSREGDLRGAEGAMRLAIERAAPADWSAAMAFGGWPDRAAIERVLTAGPASPLLGPCPFEPSGACTAGRTEDAVLAALTARLEDARKALMTLDGATREIVERLSLIDRAIQQSLVAEAEARLTAGDVVTARRLLAHAPLDPLQTWPGLEKAHAASLGVWAAVLDGDPQAAYAITLVLGDHHPVWKATGRMLRLWAVADLARSAPSFAR